MTKVYISSDHRGFAIKQRLLEQWADILSAAPQSNVLRAPLDHPEQYELVDLGPDKYDPEDDFNDYAIAVATNVRNATPASEGKPSSPTNVPVSTTDDPALPTTPALNAPTDTSTPTLDIPTPHEPAYGILICGSAHGISMQANRFKGIRAICGYTEELAQLGRQHNDANVLCLSADFMDDTTIDEVIRVFLATDFLAEPRFIRRNHRLDEDYSEEEIWPS